MELVKIKSSQIDEIGHDAETSTLFIRFKAKPGQAKGALYSYSDFDSDAYINFATAESIGSYFYKNIKGKYNFAKVDETAKDGE